MRKLLFGTALALCLVGGVAVAQNINKAVQLSQDPTGKIGADTNTNLYFPGHLLTTGSGTGGQATTPTISVGTPCGTAATVTGTDTMGTIVTGASNSVGCVMLFSQPYLATPYCIATSGNVATPIGYTSSTSPIATTGISFSYTGSVSLNINYMCSGSK